MGKSTLARTILAGHPKRFIVDPRGEHDGDVIAYNFVELLDYFEHIPQEATGLTVVYRSKDDPEDYSEHLFDFVRNGLAGWAVMVDEVDQFCKPQYIPYPLRQLLNYSFHDRISVVMCARRPAAVHRDLTALADYVHIFKTTEPNDLKYLAEVCGKSLVHKLPALQPFHFITHQI